MGACNLIRSDFNVAAAASWPFRVRPTVRWTNRTHFSFYFFASPFLSSASSSSVVGRVPRNFVGKLVVNRQADTPIGLVASRIAYSAIIAFFDLQRMIPILGWSS